jgi:hypothetical protein
VFNEGFYELFSLLQKQKGSHWHIRCHTFNTQANGVATVCPVITKIFNPMQVLDGHISTFLEDTQDLFVLVNNFLLPVIYCSIYCSLIQCSYSMQFFVRFNFNICVLMLPTIYSVLFLDCVPGILIPTTTIIKRVNKHHTSDCTVFVIV